MHLTTGQIDIILSLIADEIIEGRETPAMGVLARKLHREARKRLVAPHALTRRTVINMYESFIDADPREAKPERKLDEPEAVF